MAGVTCEAGNAHSSGAPGSAPLQTALYVQGWSILLMLILLMLSIYMSLGVWISLLIVTAGALFI